MSIRRSARAAARKTSFRPTCADEPREMSGGRRDRPRRQPSPSNSFSANVACRMKTHPHAEASYTVIPFGDGSFAVEVRIPDSHPAKVSPFASEADAEAWIADHRQRV